MVLPGLVAAWNHWTDFSDPEDFMEQSRAHGHTTIGSVVDAYVVELTGMRPAWASPHAEELEDMCDLVLS